MTTRISKVAKFDSVKKIDQQRLTTSLDMTFHEFLDAHLRSILKLYLVNEKEFDLTGMHSRPHIIRSLFLTEIIMNFYTLHCGVTFHKIYCYIPVAFHSLGRRGNGEDLWKTESAMFCKTYMMNKGLSLREAEKMASYVSSLLIIDEYHQIVRDIEIFEILRMIRPEDFDETRLYFLSDKDLIATNAINSDSHNNIMEAVKGFVIKASGELAYLSLADRMETPYIIDSCLDILSQDSLLSSLIDIPSLRDLSK